MCNRNHYNGRPNWIELIKSAVSIIGFMVMLVLAILFFLTFAHCDMPGEGYYNALGYRGSEWEIDKPTGVVRIVCLGDSVTEGGGESQSWPAELQAILGTAAYQVYNAGLAGDNAYGCLYRLRIHILAYRPDILILMVGINDTAQETQYNYITPVGRDIRYVRRRVVDRAFAPDLFKYWLWKIKQSAEDAGVKIIFIVERYAFVVRDRPAQFPNEFEYALSYFAHLREVYSIFPDAVLPVDLDDSCYADRVHLNNKGNFVIAAAAARLIGVAK